MYKLFACSLILPVGPAGQLDKRRYAAALQSRLFGNRLPQGHPRATATSVKVFDGIPALWLVSHWQAVMVRPAAGRIGEWTGLDPSACFGVSLFRHEIVATDHYAGWLSSCLNHVIGPSFRPSARLLSMPRPSRFRPARLRGHGRHGLSAALITVRPGELESSVPGT